jgi:hypothetical protein
VPLCNKCREMLPPTIMFATENGEQICAFCKTGKSVITLEDDEGHSKQFTKQEAVGKYREFTKNIANKPNIQKLLIKTKASI